jgi:hypothetical protein
MHVNMYYKYGGTLKCACDASLFVFVHGSWFVGGLTKVFYRFSLLDRLCASLLGSNLFMIFNCIYIYIYIYIYIVLQGFV